MGWDGRTPLVRPIKATLKSLNLPTVTLRATSIMSASSVYRFLCRVSDAFSSSLTHAAINRQTPSHTVLCQASGSSAAVLQSSVVPNIRRFSATQSVHFFYFPPSPRSSAFSRSCNMTLVGNLWSSMRSSAPDHNNVLVSKDSSILSHPVRLGTSL